MKPTDPSFEDAEPLPWFYDTASAVGLAGLVLYLPMVVAVFAGLPLDIVARVVAAAAPLVIAASLTREVRRRAKLRFGTPRREKSLRYDVFYGLCAGCVSPAFTLPILVVYTSLSSTQGAVAVVTVSVLLGAAGFWARRHQRVSAA